MNKNLLILPAMVFTMGLASCAKTISRDDALKFIKENYKNTELKAAKSADVNWNFENTKGEYATLLAKIIVSGISAETSENLKGSYKYTEGVSATPMNESRFPSEDDVKFTLKGKELTMKYEGIDTATKEKAIISSTCNSEGYIYFTETSFDNIKLPDDSTFTGKFSYKINF